MIFVAIILVMVYILPESPRWLLAHRREDEAKHVLSMLNDHDINMEFNEIRASIQAEQAAQVSWSQMFKGGLGTRRVLLGMILQLAQQLSGVNACKSSIWNVKQRLIPNEPCSGLLSTCRSTSLGRSLRDDRQMGCRWQCCLILLHNHHIHCLRRQSRQTSAIDGRRSRHGSCILRRVSRSRYRRCSPWF